MAPAVCFWSGSSLNRPIWASSSETAVSALAESLNVMEVSRQHILVRGGILDPRFPQPSGVQLGYGFLRSPKVQQVEVEAGELAN
jgi:hypothetical protein